MKFFASTFLTLGALSVVSAGTLPFGIIFDNGKLGVNFFGFNAAVGIGGPRNADGTGGGLHVEAGTPFGQRAVAGLGGSLSERHSGGGLYAGATAGGGISASAGLNGDLSDTGARGSLYSRAAAGPLTSGKSIDKQVGTIEHQDDENESYEREVEAVTKKVSKAKKVVKEYETVRPAVYHKELNVGVRHSVDVSEDLTTQVPVNIRKHYSHTKTSDVDRNIGYGTAYLNAFLSPTYKRQTVVRDEEEDEEHVYETPVKPTSVNVQKHVTYRSQHRPGFFEDIFNIPISTLGAVSRFLSNTASAKSSGSLDVRKSVSYN